MPPRVKRVLLPAVLIVLPAFAAVQIEHPSIRRRTLLALVVVLLVPLLPAAKRLLVGAAARSTRQYLLLSLGVVGLFTLLGTRDPSVSLLRLALQLAGWMVLIAAALGGPGTQRGRLPDPATAARAAVGLGVASFVTLAATHWLVDGHLPLIVDETLYLLQAHLFDQPGFARPIDPALAPFFTIRHSLATDGRMITQYPPGWPFVLWLFSKVHAEWWAGSVLGAASVYLTYRLGRSLRSPMAGLIAAALLGVNSWFVVTAGSYLSHAADAFLVLVAALLLIHSGPLARPKEWIAALGGGAALGVLAAARPATGVALAVSLWLWSIVRSPRTAPYAGRLAVALAIGALPFALLTLAYNNVTTGHPLTFGYAAVNGPFSALGFGIRGVVDYAPDGAAFLDVRPFTLRIATANAVDLLADATTMAIGSGLLLPLLLLGRLYRFRIRAAELACFVVLPVIHFFYFWSDIRFVLVLLPFVFVELGALLAHVWERAALIGRRMVVASLAASLATSVSFVIRRHQDGAYRQAIYDAVAGLRNDQGKVLLFVDSPPTRSLLYQSLYALNVDQFPGPVVVARHRGLLDVELMRRFPDYRPYLIRDLGRGRATLPDPIARP